MFVSAEVINKRNIEFKYRTEMGFENRVVKLINKEFDFPQGREEFYINYEELLGELLSEEQVKKIIKEIVKELEISRFNVFVDFENHSLTITMP
jgi:hypothetical protein